ncbi:MAG: hypothetical protein M3O09_18445 [Acidobacteriota bacterium]|nr:hypothetical protein [Acidobacteriota bacterium]
MYPANDLRGAEQRLRDFLIYRFGGPPDYIEKRGHPRLRARPFPFQTSRPVRDRWMLLMNKALTEAACQVSLSKCSGGSSTTCPPS